MVRKLAVAGYVVVIIGVMIIDKYSTFVGAAVCSVLVYWSTSTFLKAWVEAVLLKVDRGLIRFPRPHHRKKLMKLRSTFSSGNLLPWIEKLIILKTKFNQRSLISKASQSDDDYDQEDLSPSSEHSFGPSPAIQNLKFCGNSPNETSEIKSFVHNLSRCYIKSWYGKISHHEDFLHELDYILEDILVYICGRLSKLNLNQLFNQIFILAHNHILNYQENASECYRQLGKDLKRKSNRNGELHPALRNPKSEFTYLSIICETILDLVGPQDMLLCPLVRTTITEILTRNLLLPTVEFLSDPAFLFWTVVYFSGDANLLNQVSMDTRRSSIPENIPNPVRQKADLSLPLKDGNKRRLQTASLETQNRRTRLTRAKSFSYNSLLELDDTIGESSGSTNSNDMRDSMNHQISDNNVCNSTIAIAGLSSDVSSSGAEDGYFVSRPPFSLYPVPGHSRKAELVSHKSSPSRILPCLPKRKAKAPECSMHTSHSLDELLLPPAKVFQLQGQHILPTREARLAPSISVEVEQAEEATEAADLQQFFNITIPSIEKMLDTKLKKYILYCIEYYYLEQEPITSRAEEEPTFIPCCVLVRRRFREFLALQYRLENSPKLKKYLKGIRGPSKWLSSAFSATDKRNVEKRRLFLQGYLQKLCNKETLTRSSELQEFLAYKGDPQIAFVKKASDLNVPRLDKLVVRGVMGAIDLLKTALPSLPQESPSSGDGPKTGQQSERTLTAARSILTGFTRSKSDTRLPTLEFSCRMERISPLSQDIYNFLDSFDISSSPEDSRPNSPNLFAPFSWQGPSKGLLSTNMPAWKRAASRLDDIQPPPPAGPRPRGDGCDSLDLSRDEGERRAAHMEKIQETFQAEIPLANTLIDSLISVLFSAHPLSDDYAAITLKMVLGDMLQKWMQKKMSELSSKEYCIHYLHNLHDILWPSNLQNSKKIKDQATCREAAFQALLSLFPGKFAFLFGISDVNVSIATFLDCLQNCLTNRNLLYQVIDVVMDMICAQDLQQVIL